MLETIDRDGWAPDDGRVWAASVDSRTYRPYRSLLPLGAPDRGQGAIDDLATQLRS